MKTLEKKEAIAKINQLGKARKPFMFVIDYNMRHNMVFSLDDLHGNNSIKYDIHGKTNVLKTNSIPEKEIIFDKKPPLMEEYAKGFNCVKKHLTKGNSYLTNLTYKTSITCNLSLEEIFQQSKAPYKLLIKDDFVVFSPETFIKINEGKIYSFPMKGTIDANIPNAKEKILSNHKEAAEHATITDLIRNDLSMVARHIKVDKYRYIDTLNTNQGKLLQVSSQISGVLPKGFEDNLGNILFKLLPAGSISGAPKEKTMEIIAEAENYNRQYYTGVFGIFDGKNLDCGVMIRFIEQDENGLSFKSGGGITINSNMEEEYAELIKKVYLPFN